MSRSNAGGAGNGAGAGEDSSPSTPAKPRKARRTGPQVHPHAGQARGQPRQARGGGAAGNGKGGARVVARTPVGVASAPLRTPPPRLDALSENQGRLLGDLFAVVEEHASDAARAIDRDAVAGAFVFACEHHADQRRKSGEDFINHPVGVAKICAGMRLDTETLCAALLHDTVEDTSASLDEVREQFGEEVATLVDGVTKLTGITFQSRDEAQAENYRKMMVAMASDPRVILIKLADRLHNMRTLGRAAQAEADREGQGDAGHLRADRPPPGHPRDQVGAGGSGLRRAAPAQVRGDQVAGGPAAARARALRGEGRQLPGQGAGRRWASRPGSPVAPSTSTRSTRR